MNKFYALLAIVCLSITGSAQSLQMNEDMWALKIEPTRENTQVLVAPRGTNPQFEAMRATDILFEDFQTGSADLPDGWSTLDVESTDNDGNENPNAGEFNPAFRVGDAAEANLGGYWPVPDFPGNTFAMANDDGPPCNCFMDFIYLEGPSVSLADVSGAAISFDIFHDQNFGGGDASVEYSTDDGENWDVVACLELLPVDQDVWQTVIVLLDEYLGEESFKFRFTWTDGGNWASGFAVDNVGIGSLPEYNAASVKSLFGNWNVEDLEPGLWHYSEVPASQVSPLAVSAVVSNNGQNALTNVNFELEIFQDGSSAGTWMSDQTIETLNSLNAENCEEQVSDTLSVVTDFTPALGTITYDLTVMNESGDDEATDDVVSGEMEVTEFMYARDLGMYQAIYNLDESEQIGNTFDFYAEAPVGGIDFCFNGGADAIDAVVQGWVYNIEGYDDNGPIFGGEFYQTQEYELVDADGNGAPDNSSSVGQANWITLPFQDGAETFNAGQSYLAVVTMVTGSAAVPNSGTNVWPASWLGSGVDWGWLTGIPMVRLNMNPSVAVEEVTEAEFEMGEIFPNPATDSARLNYSVAQASDVQLTIFDASGRIVLINDYGTVVAGEHNLVINVGQFEAGVYTYTLTAGTNSATKQLIVQ